MTDDTRALLSAIVADPADDTARLAYADCIEEHGNPARAEFIRAQVEAERLHPDSNARLALERQAEALFAEHWIDWWGEVCVAVGLPTPAPKPTSRLGLYARALGFGRLPGTPYSQSEFTVQPHRPTDGLESAMFRRGFADAVHISQRGTPSGEPGHTLNLWLPEFPLASLTVTNPFPWNLGARPFAGVQALSLIDYDQDMLRSILESKMFPRLDDLTLFSGDYIAAGQMIEEFANQVAEEVRLLRDRKLKRLSLQVWTDAAATAVAEAAHLASLEALDVDILPDVGSWESNLEGAIRRVETLSRSPHLAGLQELTVSGDLFRPAFWMIAAYPSWTGLRKLTINTTDHTGFSGVSLYPLLLEARLPALEELRINRVRFTHEVIDMLIRSPLLKQLRHLAFDAYGVDAVSDADLRRLPEMFDLDRLETFRFNPDHDRPGLDELKRQLGDRLRMP